MKKVTLLIEEFNPESGCMRFTWEDNSKIKVTIDEGSVLLEANKKGLLSLANHLVTLAQDDVPWFQHLHLDDLNGLEE